jgi:prepilin-type N-terminal cleavage/methylation domain-containing protein
MLKSTKAFTLIEVLIAIVLVGIILPPLYKLTSLMRESNNQIFKYVEEQSIDSKIIDTLYLDLISSDGNITIKKEDGFSRVCIEESLNSLYGRYPAKVCWVVAKEHNSLIRVEGDSFKLPLNLEDRVDANMVMNNLEFFDVYRGKDGVLVLLKRVNQEAINFAVYGIKKPSKKKQKAKKRDKKIKVRKHRAVDINSTSK